MLNKICQWLDSNLGSLVPEPTTLATEPQPLPINKWRVAKHIGKQLKKPRCKTEFSRRVTRKNRQMSIKVAQKWIHKKNEDFDTYTKIA